MLNPWLWLSILVTGVVGIYAWEYRQNSGRLPWQLGVTGLGSTGNSTSTDVLLESLTPEEQAVAAELDNIELLLAQLDQDLSALTTGGEFSAAASLNSTSNPEGGQPGTSGLVSQASVDRLSRYVDEYRFLGTSARGSNFRTDKNDLLTPVQRPSSDSVLTLRPFSNAQETQPNNRPSGAFEGQQLGQPVPTTVPTLETTLSQTNVQALSGDDTTSSNISEDSADGEGNVSGNTISGNTPTFSFDQTGVVPGSLDGLNRSFIRTTPNMSPPPGTTGYVPPASLPSFNRLNQPAGTAPLPTQPSVGAFNRNVPVETPDRSQVLPPAQNSITTPLEVPAFSQSTQPVPTQPRNAWEDFFD